MPKPDLQAPAPVPAAAPCASLPGRHVLIIGGGASGVLMALQLLRHPTAGFHVTLVEDHPRLGLGIAYATTDPEHLLNTRVHNMSALREAPEHFLHWLQQHPTATDPLQRGGADATITPPPSQALQSVPQTDQDADRMPAPLSGASFVSRARFGAYLTGLLAPWQSGPDAGRLQVLQDSCLALDETGTGVVARLSKGRPLRADLAVLATGHIQPGPDPQGLLTSAWDHQTPTNPDARVVIIGTGLSMVDQVLSLLGQGHRGEIVALSRRGLLPRGHSDTRPLAIAAQDLPQTTSITALFRWVRQLARQATAAGGSWRDAVDGLRPHVQMLWRRLPQAERARFLRHAAPWWEVHRHRIPPHSEARITAAMASGQLKVLRGSYLGVEAAPTGTTEGGQLWVRLRPAQAATPQGLAAGRVIDCRGIRRDPLHHASALMSHMLGRGAARLDPLRLGLDVDGHCRIVDRLGQASERIFAIGPVSRAAFWEITAIPDIREQTTALAEALAKTPVPHTDHVES